jgi:hypothetical protein
MHAQTIPIGGATLDDKHETLERGRDLPRT